MTADELKQLTITCMYSCHTCGLTAVRVDVPVRGEENVVQWFEGVLIPMVGRDHFARNPNCTTKNLNDIRIPISSSENARVGDPQEH